MTEQLSLFGDENTQFNEGMQQLLEMDFSRCLETMDRYGRLFPWGREVRRVMELADFWKGRLGKIAWRHIGAAEAEQVFQFWVEFEDAFGYPWPRDTLEDQFQKRYFSKLLSHTASGWEAQTTKLPGGMPLGLLYLLAQRSDSAIVALQNLIASEPGNAMAYGYLGDAYFLRGDLKTARICYREAFVMEAEKVDLKRLQDRELKGKLEEFLAHGSFGSDAMAWFPVEAQLDGFFEPRKFRDLEEVKAWLKLYLDLSKAHGKSKDQALVPRLFYHGMTISDNASMMGFIKKVDLPGVRAKLKEWHPVLFARHMAQLEKRPG